MLSRLLLSGVLTAALASAGNLNVTGIVAFGDSLSDTGNDYIATSKLLGKSNATPQPPHYTTGEFTDGSDSTPATHGPTGIWLDQLAPKLGISSPAPALAGGTNFAYGGSQTLTASGPLNLIPSLNQEVSQFLPTSKSVAPSNYLYSFWSGANDIAANVTNPAVAVASADDIYNQILKVDAAGGKDFLWFNLPPLGDTPSAIGNGVSGLATMDSNAFNTEWALDVQKLDNAGLNIIPVDVDSLFNEIVQDFKSGCTVGPQDPYCFSNTSSPANQQSGDPDSYLFWDTDHPTTTGHALIADAAFAAIQANSSPAAVPEPASLALGAAGLLCLGLFRPRKFFRN